MKKLFILLLSIMLILCTACFFACNGNEEEEKHVHEYTTQVIAPTCLESGYTLHTCSCGDEYRDNYVNATGHTYSSEWSYDETYHWHGATCQHTSELKDKEGHIFDGNVCTVCHYEKEIKEYTRVDGIGKESKTGKYIYFGSYPQTDVTESMESVLASHVSDKPTNGNNNGWTSYGYYISNSNTTDFMWFKDVEHEGEKYRAVYFTSFRPYLTSNSSSAFNANQDDNGYDKENVYWFKFEPIKWRILEEKDGRATILAELILDSQDYNYTFNSRTIDETTVYANNYEYSSIRAWLNDNFYNTAFNELEKAIINNDEKTTVDNSERSTNPDNNETQWNDGNNDYTCGDTQDNVWLLSEQEVTTASYGFDTIIKEISTRQKKPSDYAKCQGANTYRDGIYNGNGYWWLRSPYFNKNDYALTVDYDGKFDRNNSVYNTLLGVVPALQITL